MAKISNFLSFFLHKPFIRKELLFLALISFSVIATGKEQSRDLQRELFSQAVELQDQNKWEQSFQKVQTIRNYPLHFLLSFNYINNNFDKLRSDQIVQFIKKHPNSSLSSSLTKNYLLHLADKQNWEEFISFHPILPSNKKLKCLYFQAAIAIDKRAQIWDYVKQLWLTDPFVSGRCDRVFDFYKETNKITSSLIWKRFLLFYKYNQKRSMSRLIALMDKADGIMAKKLYDINLDPHKLENTHLFDIEDKVIINFLIPSILKLSKLDLTKAMEFYGIYNRKKKFTENEKTDIKKFFIKQILQKKIETKMDWADFQLAKIKDQYLLEMRTRFAIRDNKWSDIDKWISMMNKSNRDKSIWNYWHARVLEENNKKVEANKIYRLIAQNRSYYGFLSAQKLGLDYKFNEKIVTIDKSVLKKLQFELFYLEELFYHKKHSLLKNEWRRFVSSQPLEVQQQLALYAGFKGWSHLEVLATIVSKSWNDLQMRFPRSEPEIFSKNAKINNFSQTYIYAIARQESAFDRLANSRVGARGYMQLMPSTAKYVASKMGVKKYKNKDQLNSVELNVKLGSAYLASLIKRYKGNRILATAAYNAGASRVDRWNSMKSASMDSWIETIPYKETRNYVKNVLTFNVIYQNFFGQKLELFNKKELSNVY